MKQVDLKNDKGFCTAEYGIMQRDCKYYEPINPEGDYDFDCVHHCLKCEREEQS